MVTEKHIYIYICYSHQPLLCFTIFPCCPTKDKLINTPLNRKNQNFHRKKLEKLEIMLYSEYFPSGSPHEYPCPRKIQFI